MILEDEYREAKDYAFGFQMGTILSAVVAAAFVSLWYSENTEAGVRAASALTISAVCAALACSVGLFRARRVIKAWRDQERVAAIEEAMRREGGGS